MFHIFHKIFEVSIDFQNVFKMQLKIEIIIRNQASTGKEQQILLVFIHLGVAKFSESLLVTKIMNIYSMKPYFPCSTLYCHMCEVQG